MPHRMATFPHALQRPDLFRNQLFINNKWVPASNKKTFEVVDPGIDTTFATCAHASEDDITLAIKAANDAFKTFGKTTVQERCVLLGRWADLILENKKDIGTILSVEQGKPLPEAIGEVEYAASFLRFYADTGVSLVEPVVTGDVPGKNKVVSYREPVGVVGAITPWNFPAAMITRKAAAAITAGCTLIIKPSELTPFTAYAMAALAAEAGIPDGVINVITGDAAQIGSAFTDDFSVRKITFTGSTRVGKLLMAQGALSVKRMSMELGGNAPLIICEDADMDTVIPQAVAAKSRNAGQTCVSPNRFLIHESRQEEFITRFTKAFSSLKVGYGLNEGSQIGPLIGSQAVKKAEAHVSDAVHRGAIVHCGGYVLPEATAGSPYFFPPTVISNCTPDMLCFREETFAPICSIFTFSTLDQGIELANQTNAGLASYVFTTDENVVQRMQKELQYGMIAINQGGVSHCSAAFGGVKESGLGREGSVFGVDEYLDIKTVHYNLAAPMMTKSKL